MKNFKLVLFAACAAANVFGCNQMVGGEDTGKAPVADAGNNNDNGGGTTADTYVPPAPDNGPVEDTSGTEPDMSNDDTANDGGSTTTPPGLTPCETTKDCDDEVGCTNDKCVSGWCMHNPRPDLCPDSPDSCHHYLCDSLSDCVLLADSGSMCSSGPCAPSGVCENGECLTSGQTSCEDGNPCTDDLCDPKFGCQHIANDNPCQDGSDLTVGDACMGGLCLGTPIGNNYCNTPADCNDKDKCDVLVCVNHECVVNNGSVCDDGIDCTVDSCDPVDGCLHKPYNSLCGDGGLCNTGSNTAFGLVQVLGCVYCITDDMCADENPCSIDWCDVDFQCHHDPSHTDKKTKKTTDMLGAWCDDNDACTSDSHCEWADTDGDKVLDTFKCVSQEFKACDDGNACTVDSCDPKGAGCYHSNPGDCGTDNGKPDADAGGTLPPGTGGCPAGQARFWYDADQDSWGKPGSSICYYNAIGFYSATHDGDCDDTNPNIHSGCTGNGAVEVCGDNIDNNGNGQTDEGGGAGCVTYYLDSDNDGYGAVGSGHCFCSNAKPAGNWVQQDSDCNDNNASIHSGCATSQTETCDGIDNNGNGQTDEENASGCSQYYLDADGDGYGAVGSGRCFCAGHLPTSGNWIPTDSDCDDGNSSIHTGCTSGGGSGSGNAKMCTLRVINSAYQLNGSAPMWDWQPGMTPASNPQCNGTWCENVADLKTTSTTQAGAIIANAQCKSGSGSCGVNATWGVYYLNGATCDPANLQMLTGVFDWTSDCNCHMACVANGSTTEVTGSGNPNLVCKTNP